MIEKATISGIVKQAFNEEVIKIHTIYAGGMNFVYEAALSSRTIMLKVYTSVRSHIAAAEFAMLKAGKKQGVLMPEPISFGKIAGVGYLVYEKIEGVDLNFGLLTADEQIIFCADLVHHLKLLTKISFDHFGNMTEEKNTCPDWQTFLVKNIQPGLAALRAGKYIPELSLDQLTEFMLDHPLLKKPCSPGLVWGDLKSENILVKDNRIACLLDFESCFSGDPLLSLGYLFAREGDSKFYQTIIAEFRHYISFSDEDIYFYTIFRLLRISKYLDKPLPTGKIREPVLSYFPGIQKTLNLFDDK